MSEPAYTAVPPNEDEEYEKLATRRRRTTKHFSLQAALYILSLIVVSVGLGFGAGWEVASSRKPSQSQPQIGTNKEGSLSPQSLIPQVPMKEVVFDFPTEYQDTDLEAKELWEELMPLGAGFIRVPFPRQYGLPPSKVIPDDHELAEIYSMSMTHQIHCLGVLRDVIMKYEAGSTSRFVGAGHEYHCIDYIRQAILCAGDTTLDHADVVDASGRPTGFTGANSTHQCRDWDTIIAFLIKNRSSNKTGILS